jgi:AcrR family transcriptional regulator
MAQYHNKNLRQILIRTALEIISEKGVKVLSIREVARRAKVSHNAPYRHFKDKSELLSAIAQEGFDIMVQNTKKRFEQYPADPLLQFWEGGLSYIDFAIDNPSHYRVMFGNVQDKVNFSDDLTDSSKKSFNLLLSSIINCQTENLVKKGDPKEMALTAWAIVHGFAMLCIEGYITIPDGKTSSNFFKKLIFNNLYLGLKP